jgi:hypothetical protein
LLWRYAVSRQHRAVIAVLGNFVPECAPIYSLPRPVGRRQRSAGLAVTKFPSATARNSLRTLGMRMRNFVAVDTAELSHPQARSDAGLWSRPLISVDRSRPAASRPAAHTALGTICSSCESRSADVLAHDALADFKAAQRCRKGVISSSSARLLGATRGQSRVMPALLPKRRHVRTAGRLLCSQEDLRPNLHQNVGTTWEHNPPNTA